MNRAGKYFSMALILALAVPAVLSSGGGVGPYPPLDQVYAAMESLAQGPLAELVEIGRSVEGRPIMALHVRRDDGQERPEALITGNIHAGEVISSRVAMEIARRLIEDDHKDPWITSLLDRSGYWIVPVLNPDGYHRVISTGGSGGEIGGRKNASGVDLNRNYPLAPGAKSSHPMAGNHRPRSQYYMGPAPLSEPETQAIDRLARERNFYAAVNLHSVAGKFLYPHCFTRKNARHYNEFRNMGLAFRDKQPKWQYDVENSYGWYPTLGDMDDYLYLNYGVMSVTVEHGTISQNLGHALTRRPMLFWFMNPTDPEAWVENDADAVLAATESALDITGGKPFDPAETAPIETGRVDFTAAGAVFSSSRW